jgi:hypothetical protein
MGIGVGIAAPLSRWNRPESSTAAAINQLRGPLTRSARPSDSIIANLNVICAIDESLFARASLDLWRRKSAFTGAVLYSELGLVLGEDVV